MNERSDKGIANEIRRKEAVFKVFSSKNLKSSLLFERQLENRIVLMHYVLSLHCEEQSEWSYCSVELWLISSAPERTPTQNFIPLRHLDLKTSQLSLCKFLNFNLRVCFREIEQLVSLINLSGNDTTINSEDEKSERTRNDAELLKFSFPMGLHDLSIHYSM